MCPPCPCPANTSSSESAAARRVRATLIYMSLENPFQDPLRFERRVPECAMVIFGANGDLTKRKLLPALYRLAYERRLDAGFAVLGISRTPMTDDQFREKMLASVKEFLEDSPFDADVWTAFAQGIFYMAGNFDDAATFPALDARLRKSIRPGTPAATCSSIFPRSPASTSPSR